MMGFPLLHLTIYKKRLKIDIQDEDPGIVCAERRSEHNAQIGRQNGRTYASAQGRQSSEPIPKERCFHHQNFRTESTQCSQKGCDMKDQIAESSDGKNQKKPKNTRKLLKEMQQQMAEMRK